MSAIQCLIASFELIFFGWLVVVVVTCCVWSVVLSFGPVCVGMTVCLCMCVYLCVPVLCTCVCVSVCVRAVLATRLEQCSSMKSPPKSLKVTTHSSCVQVSPVYRGPSHCIHNQKNLHRSLHDLLENVLLVSRCITSSVAEPNPDRLTSSLGLRVRYGESL